MRKRILIVAAAIAAIIAAAVWFAAEESYVLRLNASLGTALNVDKHGEVLFGNVYGQEERSQTIRVQLSHHAQNDDNLDGVDYTVSCRPNAKVVGPFGTDPKLFNLDDICQYTTGDLGGFKLFNVQPKEFIDHTVTVTFPDCEGSTANPAKRINLNCDQDTAVVLGGSVSILRTGLQGTVKKIICNEKEGQAPGCNNTDNLVDCDGIASRFAGCDSAHVQVKKGSPLTSWPTGIYSEGIDLFDNDNDGQFTKGLDDLHLEDPSGSCTTAFSPRDGKHDLGLDCKVLDLNNDLADGQGVECDLETATLNPNGHSTTGTACPPPNLKFFDANGNGFWDNGEDIVHDVNGDGIFN